MSLAPSRRPTTPALALWAALGVLGCRNLDHFDSKPGEAYCGTITGSKFQDGFIPNGARPNLALSLRLDTSKLTSEPGILNSNDVPANTDVIGLCKDQQLPLFQDAPLRAIPEVDNDALATLSFGEGHEHDFFAWVDSTCQGTLLSVVSLLKNDQVEVRLFKAARRPATETPPEKRPGFAVFHLVRQHSPCPTATSDQ